MSDVFSKLIINKFLPDVTKYHMDKISKQNETQVKNFLQSGVHDGLKESQSQHYVGTLFAFLDEKKFKEEYHYAEKKLAINTKEILVKSRSQKDRILDYTNVYRYIILHDIQKPKPLTMSNYIGKGGSNKDSVAKETQSQALKKTVQSQQTLLENDDFFSNDPKMILLYDPDEKNKKRALKEISKEMFRDVIIKIEEQNKTKNLPVHSSKLSNEKQQKRFMKMNNRLYQLTKKQLDKTKNTLLKCNTKDASDNLQKLEEKRKKIDLDYTNVNREAKIFYGAFQQDQQRTIDQKASDQKHPKQQISFPSIKKGQSEIRSQTIDQKNDLNLQAVNRRQTTKTTKNGGLGQQTTDVVDTSSISVIKSPTKGVKRGQGSEFQLGENGDFDDFQYTQDQINEGDATAKHVQQKGKMNPIDFENLSKDLGVLAEKSQESTKIYAKTQTQNFISIDAYIQEMEKKSFYFRSLASAFKNPTGLIIDMFQRSSTFAIQSLDQNHISKSRLILKGMNLDKNEVYYIVKNYQFFANVQIVNISSNQIKDYSGFVLVNILSRFSPNLMLLNLKGTGIGLETIKCLRDYLSGPICRLEVLNLSSNKLEDTAFCELCIGISQNFSLKALDFSNNNLTHVSMKIFNSIVKYSRILQEVHLSKNYICNEGIEIIAKNLGRNKGLQILNLSNVGLSDICSKNLQSMLMSNKVLKSLDLSENQLTNEGLKDILKALEKNDILRHLSLVNNHLEWSALKLIRNTQSKLNIKKNLPDEFSFSLIHVMSSFNEPNSQ